MRNSVDFLFIFIARNYRKMITSNQLQTLQAAIAACIKAAGGTV